MRKTHLLSLTLAILLCFFAAPAEELILTAPAEPFATNSLRSLDGDNWEYQTESNDILVGVSSLWEYRGFVRFNTEALPPNAVIQNLALRVTVSQASVDPTITVDARALGILPSSGNADIVAGTIGSNGSYISACTLMQAEGEYTEPLGASAINILQASIQDGRTWFGVGFIGAHLGANSDGVIAGYSSPTPPQLLVTYYVPFVAAPTGFTAEVTIVNEIQLDWTDNADNELGYYISHTYRPSLDVEPDRWFELALLDSNSESFTHFVDLLSGYYQYRVRAFNDEAVSGWAESEEVYLLVPPLPPINVIAEYTNPELIEIGWVDRAEDETFYLVERRHRPIGDGWDEWTLIEPDFPANTQLVAFSPDTTGDYKFRVAAGNDSGVSVWVESNELFIPPLPAAPGEFDSEFILGENDIVLTWVDHATYESGFRLERRYQAGDTWTDWELMDLLNANVTTWTDFFVEIGPLYEYRLHSHNERGNSEWVYVTDGITSTDNTASTIPESIRLLGNYPNPFNNSTEIAFELSSRQQVEITIYNLLGKEVAQLAGASFSAGYHVIPFDASSLTSGMYLYRFTAGDYSSLRKMILLK